MSQPPLNALRAFEAVARLGSFNAAAKALFVTQSAVSHQASPIFMHLNVRNTRVPIPVCTWVWVILV